MVLSFATIVACQHIALVVTVYDAAAVPVVFHDSADVFQAFP
jgi:hypothetical protein